MADTTAKKPTPAQKNRLRQIARGYITRSGASWVNGYYHATGVATGGITYGMMCGLQEAGWITDEPAGERSGTPQFNLTLTAAGRATLGVGGTSK